MLDKEKLYEDTINLKTRLNQLQEENTKLKTRNTHLENEACKFEKMVHQASIDPKKQSASQTRRAEMVLRFLGAFSDINRFIGRSQPEAANPRSSKRAR